MILRGQVFCLCYNKIMNKNQLKQAGIKTYNNFKQFLPILLGIILLIALMQTALPKNFWSNIFIGNNFLDPLIGAIFGSIAAGNPLTSYIIGGELLDVGVSLVAVTAFLLAWVTVGVIQLPAESLMLGKKFAIIRNIVSFFSAIVIAVLVVFTIGIL